MDWLANIDFTPGLDLIARGGPVVIAIALMSVAALTVALLKFAQFIGAGIGRGGGLETALGHWREGDAAGAFRALERRRAPAAKALLHAMRRTAAGAEEAVVREDGEEMARRGLASLRAHLRVLEATAQTAPLLGLFGTVIGMMAAFQALQAAGGDADPAALAGGIWTALVTTAVGLAAAIPAGLALYWFEGRIERETVLVESALTRLFTGPSGHSHRIAPIAARHARDDLRPHGPHAAE